MSNNKVEKFEVGKFYKHTLHGHMRHILQYVNTTLYGRCLLAENEYGDLEAIGDQKDKVENYIEIEPKEYYNAFLNRALMQY